LVASEWVLVDRPDVCSSVACRKWSRCKAACARASLSVACRSCQTLGVMKRVLLCISFVSIALALVILAATVPQFASAQGATRMSTVAKGTFTVDMKPQAEPTAVDGVNLGRMLLDKRFEGDLVGTGKGEMLTALTSVKG